MSGGSERGGDMGGVDEFAGHRRERVLRSMRVDEWGHGSGQVVMGVSEFQGHGSGRVYRQITTLDGGNTRLD